MAAHSSYSCPENSMDRGAWLTTIHEFAKSWKLLKQFSMHTQVCIYINFFMKFAETNLLLSRIFQSDSKCDIDKYCNLKAIYFGAY